MEQELFDRFPDMKPIDSPPGLSTVNGIGMMMYGRRDFDPVTHTYVKTRWFTLLFLPILAVGSYRVVDAPNGGWFFLGKVPISAAARLWTFVLMFLLIGVGGFVIWDKHTSTPEYQASKKLREAEQARKQGNLPEAARKYLEVAHGTTEHAGPARQALEKMTADEELRKQASPAAMAEVFRLARQLSGPSLDRAKLAEDGLRFVEARSADDPAGCLALLEVVEDGAAKPEPLLAAKEKLIEQLRKDKPAAIDLLSKLAVVYERTGRVDRCEALLAPHREKLGISEGARILGRIYSAQGKIDEAFALLQPYVEQHLKRLNEVEKEMTNLYRARSEAIQQKIESKQAPGFPYDAFQMANDQKKQQIWFDYVFRKLNEDPDIRAVQDRMAPVRGVVPVAMDLGIVRLRRGQAMTDAAQRKAELELAEKTFLSVQGQAGQSADYKLSLAQVYYWMGRQADGKKLLDEVLQADGRKYETLIAIVRLLRELGDNREARTLSEEAYNKPGATPQQKSAAAEVRALCHKDEDDELKWLELADSTQPNARALLASARARKASREGREDDAIALYRQALDIYSSNEDEPAFLNNGSLACSALFGLTGDLKMLSRAASMQEKAAALRPRSGILVGNAAASALSSSYRELVSDRIDLGKLRRDGGLDLFGYLYEDDAGRKAQVKRLRESASVKKALDLFDRALLMASKNTWLYSQMSVYYNFIEEEPSLRILAKRADEAKLDLSQARQDLLDFYQGKNDAKFKAERATALKRAEKILEAARPSGGLTFAVAAVSVVRQRLGQEPYGPVPDLDDIVKLAEEAHKAAPSTTTANQLEAALLARGSAAMAAAEPEYAGMVRRARRALNSTDLVAVALWREGKSREAALANPDVRRALGLIRDSWKKFPRHPSPRAWAMLRAAHPEEASAIAQALPQHSLLRTGQQLDEKLSVLDAGGAFRRCWELDSAGKKQEALAVLKQCAAEKVPMPFDP